MHDAAAVVQKGMLFGMNQTLVAVTIMIICYLVIFTERLNRAVIALFCGGLMVILGVLSQAEAIRAIDFNTLALLVGMMIIVSVTEKTGIFQYIAIWSAKKVRANPRGLLAVLTAVTALLSGYIDSVTTVLLMTPIIFQITKRLGVRPYPYLMLSIFSCNIGGAATLIGDPPNILVGSTLNLNFMDFVVNMMPLSYVLVIVLIIVFDFIWGRKLAATPDARELVMQMNEKDSITDKRLLKQSLSVLIGVIITFMFAHYIHLETGTIAMFGASIMLILYSMDFKQQDRDHKVEEVFNLVDWTTIFFFMGLFVVVFGIESTGVLTLIGHIFVEAAGGVVQKLIFLFLWVGSVFSCVIDNIPFVATMIPIIKSIEADMGGRDAVMPIWWALMMGACYGGNGTLIASSANVVVAGISMKEGHHIKFFRFMAWGLPVTFVSIVISSIYLYFRYPAYTHMPLPM
ncbi:MAG: ArsB/NhaD family transporter [Lactobacillaceae bacterium]|jgi:Na+/H+ antiporter NhaD/arsenite permease-like protein|nr:ArsB/NhaD family transporter [Lactobacillaceae bacterium]